MTDEKTEKPRATRRTASAGIKTDATPKAARPSRAKSTKASELPPEAQVGGVTQAGTLPEQYDADSTQDHADPMPNPASLSYGATQAGPLPEQLAEAKEQAATPEQIDPDVRHTMISQRAYFIAQARGFSGDYSMDDWLQAEAEIDANFFGNQNPS